MVLSLREQGREIVLASDIISMLGSETTARKVIRNLVKKGWLARLVGGRYMLLPPEHGPENFGENNPHGARRRRRRTSYIGWWTAAAFHGFTTQKPMTVTVATLRQMPARTIEDTDVRFIKITERKFFGFKPYNIYGRKVAISEPEKTVIDCIDRPDLCGGAAELTRIVHGAMRDADLLKPCQCREHEISLVAPAAWLSHRSRWQAVACRAARGVEDRDRQIPAIDLRPSENDKKATSVTSPNGALFVNARRAICWPRCRGSHGKRCTDADWRTSFARSRRARGARDIGNVEIDVILTYLLQLFTEKGSWRMSPSRAARCCARWSLARAGDCPPISISQAARTSSVTT